MRQFLDFARYPEWKPGHIKSIEPLAQRDVLEKGDKVKIQLEGMGFTATVSVRCPVEYRKTYVHVC